MEVLYHQPQPVFGSHHAAMVFPVSTNLSQLPVPPAHMLSSSSPAPYTCFTTFQSRATNPSPYTPSRTPTPECPRSASRESSVPAQGGTLIQSVLRGNIPKEYSHFMESSSSSPSWPHSEHHQPRPARSPSEAPPPSSSLGASSLLSGMLSAQMSSLPVSGVASAPVLSPPPEEVQTEPMDLSCKRPSSTSSITSSSSAFHHTLPPSPCEDHQGQSSEFSLLRNLLQVGKVPQPSSFSSSSAHSSPARDRSCDSPCSDSGSSAAAEPLCGTTPVTLARGNLYNISARVSDWLMRIVQFANSIPCFRTDLDQRDRCVLLLNSWSRLLLLSMAESNFQFDVVPVRTEACGGRREASAEMECGGGGGGVGPLPDQPTVKSVEGIRSFISKCQKMEVEGEEYYFLRMLVLFNCSHIGVRAFSKVEAINAEVTANLRDHVHRAHPQDVMRYSRLLLTLPTLYGISDKMVENLFCRHMDSDSITEVEVLLKDLLATFSPGAHR